MLAVGCGTQHARAGPGQTVDLAAAVSQTQDQTARIATTVATQTQGMTVSFTAAGVFDSPAPAAWSPCEPACHDRALHPADEYIKVPADP